jgi:hypothetical protein
MSDPRLVNYSSVIAVQRGRVRLISYSFHSSSITKVKRKPKKIERAVGEREGGRKEGRKEQIITTSQQVLVQQ